MKKRVVMLLAGVVCAGMLVSGTSVNVEAAASDYSNRVDKSEIYRLILSIMVGIFISKIFVPMLPYPKYRSIAYA